MSKDKTRMKLTLRFDADQVTGALTYQLFGLDGSVFQEEGRFAGTFYFPTGAKVDVKVVGTALAKDEMQFSIVDLTLVSIPRDRPNDSILSLFRKDSACIRISDWDLPKNKDKGKRRATTIKSRETLNVVAESGQWQISGYLSVLIEKKKGSTSETKARLFHFDPEGTTGTGGDIED